VLVVSEEQDQRLLNCSQKFLDSVLGAVLPPVSVPVQAHFLRRPHPTLVSGCWGSW